MANELHPSYDTGSVLYAVIKSAVGAYANGTALEAFATGHWTSNAIMLTESGSTGQYFGTFPLLPAGIYDVEIYDQIGGSPAETDTKVFIGRVEWDGTHEILPAAVGAAMTLDLTQALTNVKTSTVGGALHGAWATAFGKMLQDVTGKLLKLFGIGGNVTPLIVFDLDDGTNPTVRTPQ